ncbi:aps kinase atp sulfurlyase pyrophosphatase fusion protein [Nannochloropsis gaditana]|uniref:Aps kinase atp sulfurlyase pyrophosphatase fusion protein n=1 Tax=Nannochloropsis gaditana TaxID=72520 RepID=W7TXI1_9STRA|nr:aps kinase atp sulfurlyase pyrophosphatase fusion protein [Nannochloropsis gaditana]
MAVWKYAALSQEEGAQGAASLPETVPAGGSGSASYAEDDVALKRRMPFCIGLTVLLAIIYVLSRTENMQCPPMDLSNIDLGDVRAQRLSLTPPHIIECAAAGEGGSQKACHLPRKKRYASVGQKGITLWMTGLSGSGKSTIAKALEEELVLKHGKHVYRLDGDNIRTGLNRDLGFSASDRAESVRRVGELACLMNDAGTITIVSLVSPYREDRDIARRRHEEQGLKFMEVFMDVPLDVVQDRDPKGLYKKVAAGEIKGFTGVDAPYEPPLEPEILLPNYKMTIDECVAVFLQRLRAEGVLEGGEVYPNGLPLPDGGQVVDLHVPPSQLSDKKAEAANLPRVLLTDIDLNWLQTVGEGWAAPLKGFMREGALVQALHHNSLLVDPQNVTGHSGILEMPTDWNGYTTRDRISMSIPIVLPITDFTKFGVERSGKSAVALSTKDGVIVAILRNPEIYKNRKEEIIARTFGVIDPGHPYIKHINSGGDWLLGGEVELLGRIKYDDGLDQYRLTAKELVEEFVRRGADAVFAFQTRNPTHAGHAYLMKTAREKLIAKGFKNPILWLSPLGGWTKEDDVPLDVRVKQHVAVLNEGMLDPNTTVMAIWPAPMIYAGPTEVIFHAKSRRNAGAGFFVVGRDPAGMKGSVEAATFKEDDLYHPDHGRYVLQTSPGLGGMELVAFQQVKYDKRDHTMKTPDPKRPDDFISISGSKMRLLARNGAVACPLPMPSDVVAANCVPPGFMVPTGWAIVVDYYQNADSKRWVSWSRPIVKPDSAVSTEVEGQYGTGDFALYLTQQGKKISPWHDLPLKVAENIYTAIIEIPMYTTAKLEVQKQLAGNPIKQDVHDDGTVRFYKYGSPPFNYGLLPQTWEDPSAVEGGHGGDNDPLDMIEVGSGPLPIGTTVKVKVLGALRLIDSGESDTKIIVIREDEADTIYDMLSLENAKPGTATQLVQWLKYYKTAEGKGVNSLVSEIPSSAAEAVQVIEACHARWQALKNGTAVDSDDFYLGRRNRL